VELKKIPTRQKEMALKGLQKERLGEGRERQGGLFEYVDTHKKVPLEGGRLPQGLGLPKFTGGP